MSRAVANAYDEVAERYASLFLGELANDAQSLAMLEGFARMADAAGGPVVDVGCGPGSAVAVLAELGLDVSGIDLSPGQIAQARHAFPSLSFEVGDLRALGCPDDSLGGIHSRYSVIHLGPERLPDVFAEWARALRIGAPLFVSFFGSRAAGSHGTPFGHTVATAYELWPPAVGDLLTGAGFGDVRIEATPIPEGGRPFDHATVLARLARSDQVPV